MLFSTKNLIRLLWLLIIVLALMAGYFQSSLEVERRRSNYFEKKVLQLENQITKDQVKETEL